MLTAGRPGLGLWLADGRAGAAAAAGTTAAPFSWKFYNLAKEHNALLKKSASRLQFLAPEIAVMNASSTPSTPALTKAYTGLETTGCDTADRAEGSSTCTLVVSYEMGPMHFRQEELVYISLLGRLSSVACAVGAAWLIPRIGPWKAFAMVSSQARRCGGGGALEILKTLFIILPLVLTSERITQYF